MARSFGATEATWYRSMNTCGEMKATDAKRLKELEAENKPLKKIVADQTFAIDLFGEIASGNCQPRLVRRRCGARVRPCGAHAVAGRKVA